MAADPTPSPGPDPALVEAVARRVLELLQEQPPGSSAGELLTVAEIATRYRVRPNWVYAHQRELGVIRLGNGPKARLRFDSHVVAAVLDRHQHPGRRRGKDHRPGARRRRRLPSRTPPPLP